MPLPYCDFIIIKRGRYKEEKNIDKKEKQKPYHHPKRRTTSISSITPLPASSLHCSFSAIPYCFTSSPLTISLFPLSNLPQNKRQSQRLILRHIGQMGQSIQSRATKWISKIAVRFHDTRIGCERLIARAGKESVLETGSDVEGLLIDHVAGITHLFEDIVRWNVI